MTARSMRRRWVMPTITAAAIAVAAAIALRSYAEDTAGSTPTMPDMDVTAPQSEPEGTTPLDTADEVRLLKVLAKSVDVDFKDATLDDLAAWIRKQGGVNVVVDHRAIADAGIDPDAVRLSLTLKQVSLDAALWHLLRPQQLEAAATNDALFLTTYDKARTMRVTRTYAIGDLVRRRDEFGREHCDADSLAEFITFACDPASWDNLGGPGSFAFFDDALAVSADWETQRKVTSALATLREAIRRQAAGDFTPISISRRSEGDARVIEALRRRVDVDITKGSLASFAKQIGELSGVNVIIDEKSLTDAGLVAEELEFSGTLKNTTLERALGTILSQADMGFVATHEAVLFCSLDSCLEGDTSTIYPVADLDAALGVGPYGVDYDTPIEDLIIMITSMVAPSSWPAGTGPGPVRYVEPWKILVIPQFDAQHREIESLLTAVRRVRAEQRQARGNNADDDPVELRVYATASAQNKDGEAGGPTAKEIADLVRDLVEPKSWSEDGVYLRAVGDRLVVRHRRSVQRDVRSLLAVLQQPEPLFGGQPYLMNQFGGTTPQRSDQGGGQWELLDFSDVDRRIVRLSLATADKHFENLFPVPAGRGLESTDRQLIQQVELAFVYCNRSVSTRTHGSFGGTSFATLRVTTTAEAFDIGISMHGFVLNGGDPKTTNVFHSWTLAKAVDDWCSERVGKHLTQNVFESLSGEFDSKLEKSAYERLRDVSP